MRYKKNSLYQFFFFCFIVSASVGNSFLQLTLIIIFSSLGLILFKKDKLYFPKKDVFYVLIIFISLIQVLFIFRSDYSYRYVLNSLIITVLWFLVLVCSITVSRLLKILPAVKVHQILNWFFLTNLAFITLQYIAISVDNRSIIPFLSNMAAGDLIKGVFTNSSVNMIILSFYCIYYFYLKNTLMATIAALCIGFTTYMSGIVLFVSTLLIFAFFYLSFKVKIKVFIGAFLGIIIFIVFSPDNVKYVERNLTQKLFAESDQARKIVSFGQTADFLVQDVSTFVFGAGAGKFSSRTAFVTAGDYVSWYPKNWVYASSEFYHNHFQLWNKKILSRPYKDGTANQPFSFYNKICGEYGLTGVLLFIIFYMFYPIKYYRHLTYGRVMIFLLLAYFILDYWFEYFTVVIFFEIFLYMDILRYNNEQIQPR